MQLRCVVRLVTATLITFFGAVYVAAKLHFFMRYGTANYVREHLVY
jgi:hypothetical protein